MINIEQFDHVGIRITDRERAVKYYESLGFKIEVEVDFDAVIVMKIYGFDYLVIDNCCYVTSSLF